LFKLHAPLNYIVGGAYFVRFHILPSFLAWEAFGEKNGTQSYEELENKIAKYRSNDEPNPQIGCIILGAPFFFAESDWIPAPPDWGKSIVQGKTYYSDTPIGKALFAAVHERIGIPLGRDDFEQVDGVREGLTLAKYRIGQGTFRVMVTEAYHRRCAISGEKTLPVLDAAHIVPFSEEGSYSVQNGLLLRKDIHTLYDKGYLTVTPSYHVEVSSRLKKDYGNGKIYYAYHGQELPNLPSDLEERPSKEYLMWHAEHVYT
ncbi:MAG: HNH endonuclease, partial [Clostridia bacterium]|nr:HNH endonuclease [Clostridia bacterium]